MSEKGKKSAEKNGWYKWDWHIRIASKAELPEDRKKNLLQALAFLRNELGEHFFKNSNPEHPIYNKITGKYYDHVILIGGLMEYFKSTDCNYNVLLKLIRSAKDCEREGIPFLEIGGAYQAAGFDIKFPQPQNSASPDIELVNRANGERVFVEVTMLEERQDRRNKDEFYRRMFNEIAFGRPLAPHGGKFLVLPTKEEEEQLVREIREIKERCNKEKVIITIENELAILGFAHRDLQEELQAWLEEKKCHFLSVYGPPLNVDETPRITGNKLKKEAEQLPADNVGLIYIPVPPLYFFTKEVADKEIISEVKRKLSQLPHVLGVVMYSKIGVGEEHLDGAIYRELSCHRVKVFPDGTRLDMLFVFNDKCNVRLYPDTLNKIYRTLGLFRAL